MKWAISKLAFSAALAAVTALATTQAFAGNAHFVRADASLLGDGDLSCTFKIAGLGDNETRTITCAADASAFYACFNRGGNHPQAANKEESAGPVSASGDFISGKNGQITGSLEVNPPAPTISCPGNQIRRLCSVSYHNIALTSDDASASVPGTLSRTFLDCS